MHYVHPSIRTAGTTRPPGYHFVTLCRLIGGFFRILQYLTVSLDPANAACIVAFCGFSFPFQVHLLVGAHHLHKYS